MLLLRKRICAVRSKTISPWIWHFLYAPLLWKKRFIFLPALLASYLAISCTWLTKLHCLLFMITNFFWEQAFLIKYSFQGSKTSLNPTSKSVIHLVRCAAKITLGGENGIKEADLKHYNSQNSTEFSTPSSATKFSFLVILSQ